MAPVKDYYYLGEPQVIGLGGWMRTHAASVVKTGLLCELQVQDQDSVLAREQVARHSIDRCTSNPLFLLCSAFSLALLAPCSLHVGPCIATIKLLKMLDSCSSCGQNRAFFVTGAIRQ